jgi:PHD/YefM family antitoxin component YafN of YafNO toxin-antitoxin module
MPSSDKVITSASELVGDFTRFSDMALSHPVVVTSDGKPKHVLISFDEYERLAERDQQAFLAADTPDEFLADIMRLAETGV